MLTAEYGGTGGRAIEGGMIVEEPDIEIGAGVSSKGMSQDRDFRFIHMPRNSSCDISPSASLNSAFFLIALLPTAISRRMATDQGGKRGPQSSRGGNHGSNHNEYDRPRQNGDRYDRDDGDRQNSSSSGINPNTVGVPPPVPGFGFTFPTMPNGMPMFPPGFMMPSQQQQGSGQQ